MHDFFTKIFIVSFVKEFYKKREYYIYVIVSFLRASIFLHPCTNPI